MILRAYNCLVQNKYLGFVATCCSTFWDTDAVVGSTKIMILNLTQWLRHAFDLHVLEGCRAVNAGLGPLGQTHTSLC